MDYSNKINKLMINRGLSNKEAAGQIGRAYRFELPVQTFILAKLGYLHSKRIRAMIADFFDVSLLDIPVKNYRKK